jgi:hypothetical protein
MVGPPPAPSTSINSTLHDGERLLRSPFPQTPYPMITRIPLFSVCFAALAMAFLPMPRVSAQFAEISEEGALQLAINSGGEDERRLTSHDGVMEPLALVYNQLQAVTLLCSTESAGRQVTLSPLDGGGEIFVDGHATNSRAASLVVAHDGTVDFTLKAALPGKYRILVTIGAVQYQLRLYVCRVAAGVDPFSTPPPNGPESWVP